MTEDKTLSLTERVLLPIDEGPPVCIGGLTYSPGDVKVVDEALVIALGVIQEGVLSYWGWSNQLARFGREFRHVPRKLHNRLAIRYGTRGNAFLEEFETWLVEAADLARRSIEQNSSLACFSENFIAAGLEGPPPLYEDPLQREVPIKVSSGRGVLKSTFRSSETKVESRSFGAKPDLGPRWADLYGNSRFRNAEKLLAEFLAKRRIELRLVYRSLQLAADLERPGPVFREAARDILGYHVPLGASPGIWTGKFEEILLSAAHGFIVPGSQSDMKSLVSI